MNYDDFLVELASNADDEYRDFITKGIMTKRPVLGVRVPKIRELARRVEPAQVLAHELVSREELLAQGFIIASLPYAEMKSHLKKFVSGFDSWEICDTFCASLRRTVLPRKASSRAVISDHRADFLETLDEFLVSPHEFDVRFSLVCLLDFYIDLDYLLVVFDRVVRVKNRDEYYIKMAVAWLIATCFAKFPEPTESFLLSAELPDWTFSKTISKICDSYRVEESAKARLRELRRTKVR